MKAIALVVVHGGIAYTYAPEHVDVYVVDRDDAEDTDDVDDLVALPHNIGLEALVAQAGLEENEDFIWEKPND